MPLSCAAGVAGDTFVPWKMGMPADPLGPIEQIATAPHVAIMVAKVAAAPKTFAEVEIQGESSSSALTSTVIGCQATLLMTFENTLHLVGINQLDPNIMWSKER